LGLFVFLCDFEEGRLLFIPEPRAEVYTGARLVEDVAGGNVSPRTSEYGRVLSGVFKAGVYFTVGVTSVPFLSLIFS